MYQKTLWQDHVVEYPNRFKETSLGNNLVEEVPAPGEIIQQGTPQSAKNFNNIEDGIFHANELLDYLMIQTAQNDRRIKTVTGESGTVKMTNSQTYPFNGSGSTVSLATPRDTTDYFVDVEILEEAGGSAGNVTVYNKLANGFKVKFDGSAKEVSVRYNVTGGGI